MLYWMHPQKHHNTGTLVHCSCLTIKDFAVQAGMVAMETYIDVGNILWIFYDCLFSTFLLIDACHQQTACTTDFQWVMGVLKY